MEGFDSKDKKRLKNISQGVSLIALIMFIQLLLTYSGFF